jgi:hypothetical protein
MFEMTSRYGETRKVTNNGHNLFTIEGKSHYWRVGMNDENTEIAYFDPTGGPFFCVGSDYGFGVLKSIMVEDGKEGHFKIRVEVE